MDEDSDPTIKNNNIIENHANGIEVNDESDPIIRNNTIENNLDGIEIYHGSDPTIEGNDIKNNRDEGIDMYEGGCYYYGCSIWGNRITGNSGYDIWADDDSFPEIVNNYIYDNDDGIVVEDDSGQAYTSTPLSGMEVMAFMLTMRHTVPKS